MDCYSADRPCPDGSEAILLDHCEICSGNGGNHMNGLVYDHCHRTGYHRGTLCNLCNTALGSFGDNSKKLSAAIEYLKVHDTTNAPVWNPDLSVLDLRDAIPSDISAADGI